jgi:drug/metabolite transporter (DMT)-like permease
LVVIPFAILMKEEKPSWRALIGGVIAVGGVVGMVMMTKAH